MKLQRRNPYGKQSVTKRNNCSRSLQRHFRLRLRDGAAAVEFAIVLPLLVTLLLGATDFGRFSHSTIAVANAARSGAAYASMTPWNSNAQVAWNAGIRQAVVEELSQSANFDEADLTVVAVHTIESGDLRRVSVQVTYPFQMLINWPFLPTTFDLSNTVVMRTIR